MSDDICDNPYKPLVRIDHPPKPEVSYSLAQSNQRSKGSMMVPSQRVVHQPYVQHQQEKSADTYRRDSGVPLPINLIPTDLVKCMGCGYYVRCHQLNQHMATAHDINFGDNLEYGGQGKQYGQVGSRDIYQESAPKICSIPLEHAATDPMAEHTVNSPAPEQPKEHFLVYKGIGAPQKTYRGTNFKIAKFTRGHQLIDDQKEFKVERIIKPTPDEADIDWAGEKKATKQTTLASGLVLAAPSLQPDSNLSELNQAGLAVYKKPSPTQTSLSLKAQQLDQSPNEMRQLVIKTKTREVVPPPVSQIQPPPRSQSAFQNVQLQGEQCNCHCFAGTQQRAHVHSHQYVAPTRMSVVYRPVQRIEEVMVPVQRRVIDYMPVLTRNVVALGSINELDELQQSGSRANYGGEYVHYSRERDGREGNSLNVPQASSVILQGTPSLVNARQQQTRVRVVDGGARYVRSSVPMMAGGVMASGVHSVVGAVPVAVSSFPVVEGARLVQGGRLVEGRAALSPSRVSFVRQQIVEDSEVVESRRYVRPAMAESRGYVIDNRTSYVVDNRPGTLIESRAGYFSDTRPMVYRQVGLQYQPVTLEGRTDLRGSVLMQRSGVLPIHAHEMDQWLKAFKAKFPSADEQKFDLSVTEALERGVKTIEQYTYFLKDKS